MIPTLMMTPTYSQRASEDVFVGGEFFGEAGEVKFVRIATGCETGHPRGFGHVESTDTDAAEKAVTDLNGKDLDQISMAVVCASTTVRWREEGHRQGWRQGWWRGSG